MASGVELCRSAARRNLSWESFDLWQKSTPNASEGAENSGLPDRWIALRQSKWGQRVDEKRKKTNLYLQDFWWFHFLEIQNLRCTKHCGLSCEIHVVCRQLWCSQSTGPQTLALPYDVRNLRSKHRPPWTSERHPDVRWLPSITSWGSLVYIDNYRQQGIKWWYIILFHTDNLSICVETGSI